MTIEIYFLVAALIGCWFSTDGGLEQGDYPRGVAILLFAALWPISMGMGLGLMLRGIYRGLRAKFAQMAA
jgi:hypothetical protein